MSVVIFNTWCLGGEMLVPAEENAVYRHGQAFATCLSKGLADNWSQVKQFNRSRSAIHFKYSASLM